MIVSTKPEKRNQRRLPRQTRRHGLTLIEIMIALTMTLIVLFAMMQAFQFASSEIARGRAALELSNQMRSTIDILQTDLEGVTVDVRPHTEQINPSGYFEYVEGPRRDYGLDRSQAESIGGNNFVGDYDDIIAFTTRNTDRLFRGRFFDLVTGLSGLIESSTAEVVWWTWHNNLDNDPDNEVAFGERVTLYRRSLLIRPDLNINIDLDGDSVLGLFVERDEATVRDWITRNDISVRWVDLDEDGDRDTVVANNLFDLARRENRYCHEFNLVNEPGFHNFVRVDNNNTILSLLGTRMDTQDDIMLADILAFDVKVYSRNARVDEQANLLVDPNDIGYVDNSATAVVGSFVDLGYGIDDSRVVNSPAIEFRTDDQHFQFGPDTNAAQLSLRYPSPVESGSFDIAYCTWSPHYESDGIDQDNDGVTDQGTDGQDNNGDDVPDDRDEMEVLPPYPYPARGIKITFRMIEKGSRQVRQQSMTHSFIPE